MNEVYITQQGKRKRYQVPNSLQACTYEQVAQLCGVHFLQNEESDLLLAHLDILCPKLPLQILTTEQVLQLEALTKWLPDALDQMQSPPFQQIKIKTKQWRRAKSYHLPTPCLENITCLDWYLADHFHEQFVESNDFEHALNLVAVLLRPTEKNKDKALARGDWRKPLRSKTEALSYAEQLKGISFVNIAYVLMYWKACKAWFYETYKTEIFGGSGDGGGTAPKFGWYSLFTNAAESGRFGNLQNVLLHTKFIDFCAFLIEKKAENDTIKKQIENSKN